VPRDVLVRLADARVSLASIESIAEKRPGAPPIALKAVDRVEAVLRRREREALAEIGDRIMAGPSSAASSAPPPSAPQGHPLDSKFAGQLMMKLATLDATKIARDADARSIELCDSVDREVLLANALSEAIERMIDGRPVPLSKSGQQDASALSGRDVAVVRAFCSVLTKRLESREFSELVATRVQAAPRRPREETQKECAKDFARQVLARMNKSISAAWGVHWSPDDLPWEVRSQEA